MDAQLLWDTFDRLGVRFVNYFGIGQVLELDANCSYYLDCPGVSAIPSIKNDFVNGLEKAAYDPDKIHITLSMTFIDLAHAEKAAETIALYDTEFPGMFTWSGELNMMKQALLGNNAEPASIESIAGWADFMEIFRERGVPVTIHSDLGNDAEPTKFLHLMDHALETYPDNKIVWAHMGLSKELTTMDAREHVRLMSERLDQLSAPLPRYFLGRDLQRLSSLGRDIHTVLQSILHTHSSRIRLCRSGLQNVGELRARAGGDEPCAAGARR